MNLPFWFGAAVAVVGVVAPIHPASSGTVFVSSRPEAAASDGFPESRFGHAPAPIEVQTGVDNGYASRAVIEMDQSDDEALVPAPHGDRAPAGLIFSSSEKNFRTTRTTNAGDAPPQPVRTIMESAPTAGGAPVSAQSVPALASRMGVQEVALIAGDLGFFPKTVFVSRDVPVRMFVTGASKNTLCIMMDSFQVRKQIRSQKIEEITFTPGTPGKYRFYCPVNGMEGTLVVKEFSSSTLPEDAVAQVH